MKIKRLVIFLLIVLILVLLSYFYPTLTGYAINNQQEDIYKKESALVTKVVDGDTIKALINGEEYTIRLLGINTPEKGKYLSKEAYSYLEGFLGNLVELEKDSEDLDRYGRKLRYVHFEDMILNVEILQKGLATSFMTDGLKYQDKLIESERYAKNNNLGLWEKSIENCSLCLKLVEIKPVEEYFILKNTCSHDCFLQGWVVKDDANHFINLRPIDALESDKYESKTSVWNDNHDRFFLRDTNGLLVIYYEY